MDLSTWITSKLKQMNGGRDKPAYEAPLLVSNMTRQTVLANKLEVANQGETRRKGLLGRSELPAGGGLWIKPCEAVHTVGMQFPIDLVYLDRKHRIKKVRRNVGPWRVSACLSAHSVLELPSGTIEQTLTQAGDRLTFAAAEFRPGCKEVEDLSSLVSRAVR